MVENFSFLLSAISFWSQQWKNFKNRPTFAIVTVKIKVAHFFDSQCILKWIEMFLQFSGLGYCHIGPILLCIDLFVFMCVYFVCFCCIMHYLLHYCEHGGWTWWDWSLMLWTYLPSVLWHFWLVIWPMKIKSPSPISPITCLVGC